MRLFSFKRNWIIAVIASNWRGLWWLLYNYWLLAFFFLLGLLCLSESFLNRVRNSLCKIAFGWDVFLIGSVVKLQELQFCWIINRFHRVVDVLHLEHSSLAAVPHVRPHFSKIKDLLAEMTFSERVPAFNWLMLNLLLLVDPKSASLADHTHVVALVKFMGAKK